MFERLLLVIHVSSASVALLSGFLALAFRKGARLHRLMGNAFFVSMICMAGTGAYMAAFIQPNMGNVAGGVLTLYLVATGWATVMRKAGTTGRAEWGLLLLGLAHGTGCMTLAWQAAQSPTGLRGGYPAPMYLIFGSISLLLAASDVHMLVRGGVVGSQRIARHLWRMGLALFVATISFFPGRAEIFPAWLKATHLLYVPHVLLIGTTLFWLYRVRVRKRLPLPSAIARAIARAIPSTHRDAVVRSAAGAPGQVTP